MEQRQTTVGWIKNYDFSYRSPPGPGFTDFTVTAVAGHLMSSDFGPEFKGWHSCDPFTLFDAPIQHFVNPVRHLLPPLYRSVPNSDRFELLFPTLFVYFFPQDKNQKGIEKNLLAEARKATHLMIWTDCDREGEHIGSEVAIVCRKANPDIIVSRAKFSAIIAKYVPSSPQISSGEDEELMEGIVKFITLARILYRSTWRRRMRWRRGLIWIYVSELR